MTCSLELVFPDVFSSEWESVVRNTADKEYAPYSSNEMVLGNCVCDCVDRPAYGKPSKRRNGTWTDRLKRLPVDAPGKQVSVDLMERQYDSRIDGLNRVYGTEFYAWEQLLDDVSLSFAVPTDHNLARRDYGVYLGLIAERFCSVTCGEIRRVDPEHLVFGAVLDANTRWSDGIIQRGTCR